MKLLFAFILTLILIQRNSFAQSFEQIQDKIEQERLDVLNHKILNLEVYEFSKSGKDSTLKFFKTYDSNGNLLAYTYFSHKDPKYYHEYLYEYDSLHRRIKETYHDTYLDKLNKRNTTTDIYYEYKGNQLVRKYSVSLNSTNTPMVYELPEHPYEEIEYLQIEKDSLGRTVQMVYNSVPGRIKDILHYHSNEQVSAIFSFVYHNIWTKTYYDSTGNEIEYIEYNYDKASSKPLLHQRYFYTTSKLLLREEIIDAKGAIKTYSKYIYKRE